jgi:hypothetical protein
MNASQIVAAIEQRVASAKDKRYSIWTIGITADPERRKNEHGNPKYWMQWQADSEGIARDIEKYFLDKGMKGDTGGGENPTYVYIF